MTQSLNIMFTSVGRRVALLRVFRAAYEELGLNGRIIATDCSPLAAGLQVADMGQVVPIIEHNQYADTLSEIVYREKVDVIFPLIDPDIPVIALHRDQFEQLGARVATVSHESASKTCDKWQTHHLLSELKIDTPISWLPNKQKSPALQYPLFIKPRYGSASGGCFKINSDRDLDFFVEYIKDPIVQEYLPGPEVTSDVICDTDGNVLSIVSRKRIQVRGGEVTIGKTLYDQGIADTCLKLAKTLDVSGPITIQCRYKDGSPKFTEINARLGGGAPCGVLAGADWPKYLLARIAGLKIDIPPLGTYRTGLVFSRYDDALITSQTEKGKQVLSNHRTGIAKE